MSSESLDPDDSRVERALDLATLTAWYARHGRHLLPWRQTRDPYAVMVSEVMLQQTQVSRVIPYYEQWLARWPNAPALAAAPLAEVIRLWSGLGYNRRAVNLQRAASAVVERHGGLVPLDPEPLRALPGVGGYTAAAVASFAGQRPVAVVETNVGRVLARSVLGVERYGAAVAKPIDSAAAAALPQDGAAARHHNLALMDLGATVCRSRNPDCGVCPLASSCAWRLAGCPPSQSDVVPAARFETTARFARGRIVAALRETSALDEATLRVTLPEPHRELVGTYLANLERDGLVERSASGEWTLAGAQGNTSIASPKL